MNLKPLEQEPTTHLMWFVEHGFHQMSERRKAAREELEKRGVNTKQLMHKCLCNECTKKVTKK
jgi:hypothetical protein